MTIRNSSFTDCSHFDIYFHQISGGGNPQNVVLENNFFGETTEGGFYTLFFANDRGENLTNIRLAYNSSAQGFHFGEGGKIMNVSVFGNVYGPTDSAPRRDLPIQRDPGDPCGPHRCKYEDRLC